VAFTTAQGDEIEGVGEKVNISSLTRLYIFGPRIAKEFTGETSTQRKRRFIACVMYVALTLISFFWLGSLRNS